MAKKNIGISRALGWLEDRINDRKVVGKSIFRTLPLIPASSAGNVTGVISTPTEKLLGSREVEYENFPISSCKFFQGFGLSPEEAAEGILSRKKVWEMENGDSKEQ